MQNQVFLLLGSNLGDRNAFLTKAKLAIEKQIGPCFISSSLYETEPWGTQDFQDNYLNQAIGIQTDKSASLILETILKIEQTFGRTRGIKNAARTIDIDILIYGEKIISEKDLEIPHPKLHERNFVLIPMLEIAPDLIHPVFQKSIEELYDASPDMLEVILYEEN